MSGITGKTYLERGAPVVIVTQWKGKGPRNVAIRREDGSVVVRPFRGLRKRREADRRNEEYERYAYGEPGIRL